jgi:hypothetical protein
MQSALRSIWPAILIAVALLVATPATAAEFQRHPQPNNRPDHIAVSGGIQTNDEQKFVELTADLKGATIILPRLAKPALDPGADFSWRANIGLVTRGDAKIDYRRFARA